MFLSFRTGVAARLSVGYHLYRKSEWAILVKSTTRAGDEVMAPRISIDRWIGAERFRER